RDSEISLSGCSGGSLHAFRPSTGMNTRKECNRLLVLLCLGHRRGAREPSVPVHSVCHRPTIVNGLPTQRPPFRGVPAENLNSEDSPVEIDHVPHATKSHRAPRSTPITSSSGFGNKHQPIGVYLAASSLKDALLAIFA